MSPEKLESILAYLRQLSQSTFYGTVSLRFDAGRIVLLNVQQAFKPETIHQLSQEESKPRSSYGSKRS
jgi:hypothetical protein